MKVFEYSSDNRSIDAELGTSSGTFHQQLAQKFKLPHAAPVGCLALYLVKTGTPHGYLQAQIYSNNSTGLPSAVVTNGSSVGVPMGDVATGWTDFDFNLEARPELAAATSYHAILKSVNYSFTDGSVEICWSADQAYPHYVDGEGEHYNGTDWASITTATDFCLRVYTGRREDDEYPSISNVESLVKHQTNSGKFDYSTTAAVDATRVYDFSELVSDQIDLWLSSAGFSTPVTDTLAKRMLRPYADAGVAMHCELTARGAGFRGEGGSDTRTGAFRTLYQQLQKELADGGELVDAFITLGLEKETTGQLGRGLSAGGISEDELETYQTDDDDIIQPFFAREMWTNV